jgi:hypothetical protein
MLKIAQTIRDKNNNIEATGAGTPRPGTCSANGAILILAWGNAPGLRQKFPSADSAIHLRVFFGDYLIRAFSARFGANFSLGRCPRLA